MMIKYEESYMPVDHAFEEVIVEMIRSNDSGKVYFFDTKNELDGTEGKFERVEKNPDGEFIIVGGLPVRMDKIITIKGKPGPSYDEYNNYANACLACEDLGQF